LRGDPQSILAPGMLYHDLALTLKQCSARDASQRLGASSLREHWYRRRARSFPLPWVIVHANENNSHLY